MDNTICRGIRKKKNQEEMSTEEIKDTDPELTAHLTVNLNSHIWVHESGVEQSIHTMDRSQVVHIYNDLITGRFTVLFNNDWKRILEAHLAPII
jgi:hypothetical protein